MTDKILLLEDDFFLRDGLTELLTREGYGVIAVKTCAEARKVLGNQGFGLLILDVMLPDGSGLDICREVRRSGNLVSILFLTACDEEYQVVRGLDSGADDYVTKPFRMQELLSRVRAQLRRPASVIQRVGGFTLDRDSRTVRKDGEVLLLTPTEYQLLVTLLSSSGNTVPRGRLLERIWDCDGSFIDDNTLSVHISRLREKIGGGHIVTVRGIGYRWEDTP